MIAVVVGDKYANFFRVHLRCFLAGARASLPANVAESGVENIFDAALSAGRDACAPIKKMRDANGFQAKTIYITHCIIARNYLFEF